MATITIELKRARGTLARELFAQTAQEPLSPADLRVVWDSWIAKMDAWHPSRHVMMRYLAEADALSEALEGIAEHA